MSLSSLCKKVRLTCRKKRKEYLIIERRYIDIHHIFIREKVDFYLAVGKGGERRERGFRQGSHMKVSQVHSSKSKNEEYSPNTNLGFFH